MRSFMDRKDPKFRHHLRSNYFGNNTESRLQSYARASSGHFAEVLCNVTLIRTRVSSKTATKWSSIKSAQFFLLRINNRTKNYYGSRNVKDDLIKLLTEQGLTWPLQRHLSAQVQLKYRWQTNRLNEMKMPRLYIQNTFAQQCRQIECNLLRAIT